MTPNTLSKNMLEAWQKTVLALSRASTKDKQDPDRSAMVRKLARNEKANILKLRETFTTEREALSYVLLNNKENIVSYMLGFHLPNIYRLLKTFERVEEKHKWSLKDSGASTMSVWDLGCGSGALSQFFIEKYSHHFSMNRVYLYDTNSLLLNAAKSFFEHLNIKNLKMFPRKVGLHDLNTSPKVFPDDLIIVGLGYVWNEIQKNKNAQKKIRELLKHFMDNNAKVLISVMEPGQDFAARSAMELRDELVEGGFHPLYPCPHLGKCPLLQHPKDWCYSEFSSDELPKDAEYIDKILEVDRTLIAASAYVFASPALHATMKQNLKETPVVVGRPRLKDEQGFSYLLCGPDAEISRIERVKAHGSVILRGEKYPEGVFKV